MNRIKIENNLVNYQSESFGILKGLFWTLDLDKVKVIGGINLMIGDDDSDFCVFIDNNFQKHFLNLTWEIDGFEKFKVLFETKFGIGIDDWSFEFWDNHKVIFPKDLAGKPLYRKSWKKKLRTSLGIDHIADGELAEGVINYIEHKT